jgi:hypothetical protein
MTIDVTFHGLCAFARQGKRFDALLLPEGGVHKPVLTIPVVQFAIGSADTTVAPLTVGHDEAGNQIAMWDLTGVTIKIGTDTADPTFGNANTGFAFGIYHPGAKTRSAAELDAAVGAMGAKVELTSGSLAFDNSRPLHLIVRKNKVPILTGHYPSAVGWRGGVDKDVRLLNKAGQEIGKIRLKEDGRDIALRITNVARVDFADGLTHFAHYYDLMEPLVGDYPMTLANSEADIDVFDCVPPVALP